MTALGRALLVALVAALSAGLVAVAYVAAGAPSDLVAWFLRVFLPLTDPTEPVRWTG